jgi:purine nucleosidase
VTGVPRVWVDTDVALGSASGDVDDGFALAALLAAARLGRIELLGISTVSGNASAAEASRCARALVSAAAFEVPVVRGEAAGEAGAALAALPEDCRIVAIGPLTNVAAAIAFSPELPGRVSLSVVGGNLTTHGAMPPLWPHEFNLAKDRPAAKAVLGASWRRLVLYPLDAMRRMRCTEDRLRRISGLGAAGAFLASASKRWMSRSRWRWGSGGFPVWDLPSALEAAGALRVEIAPARFPKTQRRFSGIPEHVTAAVAFDAAAAWSAFDVLLASSETRRL